MNRAELVKQVLLYDQLAAAAKAKSAVYREQLDTQARAELEQQGMAPTWRLPDIGTVTLPVSQETLYVADVKARDAWLAQHYPDAILEEVVHTADRVFVAQLEKRLAVTDGLIVDPGTGMEVPGYAIRPGGMPQSLTIRPTSDAKAIVREYADGLLERFEAGLS